jgi:hypothetical protein
VRFCRLTKRSTFNRSASVAMVVVLVMGMSSSLASAMDGAAPATQSGPAPGAIISYHKLTAGEVDILSSPIDGPGAALVDGHGTGYARPTSQALSAMVGELNVADFVYMSETEPVSAFDLSQSDSFPTVGDQAHQSSCSAWATIYYAQGYLEALDLDWTEAKSGNPEQLLSPAWTYNKVNGGRDLGSSLVDNFDILLDWGSATMATMPYTDDDYLEWGSASAFREAPLHRALEYFILEYNGEPTIDSIKNLLLDGTPVTFGIDANQYVPSFYDGNYIVSSYEYSSTTLNHAQTFVGFDDSVTDDGEVGAFRVVNSWGGDWGDDGYYWLSYDAVVELGTLGLFDSAFVHDRVDYQPELVAVWHFDDAPSRSSGFEVGIGPPADADGLVVPHVAPYRSSSQTYPTFMSLDVTDLVDIYQSGVEDFFLTVGPSPSKGALSSFRVEMYEGGFVPGAPTQASGQSPDVTATTPCTVTNALEYYPSITDSDALDVDGLVVENQGAVRWVGVDHHSISGGDSLQSGDVADDESTSFTVAVDGPAEISFDWRVSSEPGNDLLTFTVDGGDQADSIGGVVDWVSREYTVGNGAHTLQWTYSKDSATSSNADSGWVDNLRIVEVSLPPFIELAESYFAPYNGAFSVAPETIGDEDSDSLQVWYDWGDGSPLSEGDPDDAFSASHVYTVLDEFMLIAYAADDQGHNVSATATVEVTSSNWRPQIVAVDVEPDGGVVSPGEQVWLDVIVIDLEGDVVTVTVDFGDGTSAEVQSTAGAGVESELSLEHSYQSGSDSPFVVTVSAVDGALHEVGSWDEASVEFLVNTPPVAEVTFEAADDVAENTFVFDVSASSDPETSSSELEVRWDWNSDGTWDSEWSTDKVFLHEFSSVGTHEVVLELRDGVGLTDTVEITVDVGPEDIPEFPTIVLPLLAILLAFALLTRRRHGT